MIRDMNTQLVPTQRSEVTKPTEGRNGRAGNDDDDRQSRNILESFTANDTACWWAYMHQACQKIENTRYPVCEAGIHHAKYSADANEAQC